jgi:hypothetical protein
VVVYVFVVAVLNLALGFAVAAQLARRQRDRAPAALPAHTDPPTARAVIQPATAEDVARAMEGLLDDCVADIAEEQSEEELDTEDSALQPANAPASNTSADAVAAEPDEQDTDESKQDIQEDVEETQENAMDLQRTEPGNQMEGPDDQPQEEPTAQPEEAETSEMESDWYAQGEPEENDPDQQAYDLFRELHEAQMESIEALGECHSDEDESVEKAEDLDQTIGQFDEIQ